MGCFTRSDARFPIDCFACLDTLSYSPRCSRPTEVRTHQNRISGFTERACGNRRRWRRNRTGRTQGLRRDDQSAVAFCDRDPHLGPGTEVEPLGFDQSLKQGSGNRLMTEGHRSKSCPRFELSIGLRCAFDLFDCPSHRGRTVGRRRSKPPGSCD
jgi:hypothetical protein